MTTHHNDHLEIHGHGSREWLTQNVAAMNGSIRKGSDRGQYGKPQDQNWLKWQISRRTKGGK